MTAALGDDVRARLTPWFAAQLTRNRAGAGTGTKVANVRLHGLDRIDFGHSAEMLMLTIAWQEDGADRNRDVVIRMRPQEPGLLEPYDMQLQFDIMRALEATNVRAPKALWIEPTGDVLGRPFLVMARVDGKVYERTVPSELDEIHIRRMTASLIDQIAAIHLVDIAAAGLAQHADGQTFLDREIKRWSDEMQRVRRGPLPALERLLHELHTQRPEPCPTITLVHGDVKPGNFAFVGDDVSAVFDWELATIGDPLADIGYLELMWAVPIGIASRPGALAVDEMVSRWEAQTGITVRNREWYRAFQGYKLAVILLLGSMLIDAGHSDDPRLAEMALGIPFITRGALRELGVTERLETGPIAPRAQRLDHLQRQRVG